MDALIRQVFQVTVILYFYSQGEFSILTFYTIGLAFGIVPSRTLTSFSHRNHKNVAPCSHPVAPEFSLEHPYTPALPNEPDFAFSDNLQ